MCVTLSAPAAHAANSPPQAQLRSFHFAGPSLPPEVFIDLLAYASDADGDRLTCDIEVAPGAGTWSNAPSEIAPGQGCAILYYPDDPANPQADSFQYRVTDPWGATVSAVVEILPQEAVPGPKALSVAPVPTGPFDIEVSWLDGHGEQATYELFRRAQGQASFSSLVTLAPPFGQALIVHPDSGLTPETTYFYFVRSCIAGDCAEGQVASATTPPVPPTPNLAMDDTVLLPRESVRFITYDEILDNDDPSFGTLIVVDVEENDGASNTPEIQWLPEQRGILVSHVALNPAAFTFSYTVEAGGFQDSAEVDLSFLTGGAPAPQPDGCPHTAPPCFQVGEGKALRIPYADLLANDGVEGGGPTAGLEIRRGFISQPANGRVDLCCDPAAFWYVPDEDFVGDDVFTYQVSNAGSAAIATAEVVVQVFGNGAGIDITEAEYDSVRMVVPSSGSVAVPITFSELMQNDGGDSLELIDPCAHQPGIGTLTCPDTHPVHGYMLYETSGFLTTSFTFFRYDIQGADGQTDNSTNSQIFRTTPASPKVIVGTSDLMQVPEGENLQVGWSALLANDRIPYTAAWPSAADFVDFFGAGRPLHGSARNIGLSVSGFTYQAPTGFRGADRMAYTVLDPVSGERGVAQLVVEVIPGAPVPREDRYLTYPDRPILLDVLANDSDPQGQIQTDSLEVVAVTQPRSSYGSVALGAGGEVWYMPGGIVHPPATFSYTVEDVWGNQATGQVTVLIEARPEGPGVAQ